MVIHVGKAWELATDPGNCVLTVLASFSRRQPERHRGQLPGRPRPPAQHEDGGQGRGRARGQAGRARGTRGPGRPGRNVSRRYGHGKEIELNLAIVRSR